MRKISLSIVMIMAALTVYAQVTCDDAAIYTTTGSNAVCFELLESDKVRACFSNNYPDGGASISFGAGGVAAAVTEEDNAFYICANPQPNSWFTKILTSSTAGSTNNPLTCPGYSFGVMANGVYISPSAGIYYEDNGADVEDWEVEALTSTLGWDNNDAHKQSTGRYHYHGNPSVYAAGLGYDGTAHSGIIGWAADG